MKKYLEIYFKNLEKSWNFVSLKKWERKCNDAITFHD